MGMMQRTDLRERFRRAERFASDGVKLFCSGRAVRMHVGDEIHTAVRNKIERLSQLALQKADILAGVTAPPIKAALPIMVDDEIKFVDLT
eukprot:scaffold36486_cov253-Isochrysis_galbana.AAC.1